MIQSAVIIIYNNIERVIQFQCCIWKYQNKWWNQWKISRVPENWIKIMNNEWFSHWFQREFHWQTQNSIVYSWHEHHPLHATRKSTNNCAAQLPTDSNCGKLYFNYYKNHKSFAHYFEWLWVYVSVCDVRYKMWISITFTISFTIEASLRLFISPRLKSVFSSFATLSMLSACSGIAPKTGIWWL